MFTPHEKKYRKRIFPFFDISVWIIHQLWTLRLTIFLLRLWQFYKSLVVLVEFIIRKTLTSWKIITLDKLEAPQRHEATERRWQTRRNPLFKYHGTINNEELPYPQFGKTLIVTDSAGPDYRRSKPSTVNLNRNFLVI